MTKDRTDQALIDARALIEQQGLIDTANAKLAKGLPLEWPERIALNYDFAEDMAAHILEEMNSYRKENDQHVLYTQGAANAGRLGIRLAIGVTYLLAAQHSQKQQKIEADLLELLKRIVDLEERTPHVEGTYDPSKKDYRALDIVACNGASFIARRDNPGPCPGAGWQLSAAQGKRGSPGPRVKSLTVDAEGMLSLMNADGSTVKCDLYPLLNKVRQS